MGKKLGFVDGVQRLLTFSFDDYPTLDYHIRAKAAVQFDSFIDQRHSFLSFYFETEFFNFIGKAAFVGGF